MGVFGEFIYGGESVGGDIYGPDVDILGAELIAPDTVRINFESAIVVNDEYNNSSNYEVSIVAGNGQDVAVRSVLPIFADTTNEVILVIDKVSEGTIYQITISSLSSVTGQSAVGVAQFVGRRTKVQSLINKLPTHFNTLPTSCIRSVLTAIGLADEQIGGSLDSSLE